MPGKRKYLFLSIFWMMSCLQPQASWAGGLDKYLEAFYFEKEGVYIIPVTIRDGLESQVSTVWPLKEPKEVLSSKYFLKNEKDAKKAGELILLGILTSFIPRVTMVNIFFSFFITSSKPWVVPGITLSSASGWRNSISK